MSNPILPVSVIVPCFDMRETLGRALESCIAQHPAQIVVVDDASTDDSAGIALRYAAQHAGIDVLRCPVNSGCARARNWAVMHATQPLLAFLDADDEYLPGALSAAGGFLAHHTNAAAVRLDVEFANFPPEIVGHPRFAQLASTLSRTVPSSLVIRRAAYLALGGFPMDDYFRRAAGEDGAFSWALSTVFGNPLLTDTKRVRMPFHPGIHAERFFRIGMGMEQPVDADVAQAVEQSRRFVATAAANVAQLRALGLAPHAAAGWSMQHMPHAVSQAIK